MVDYIEPVVGVISGGILWGIVGYWYLARPALKKRASRRVDSRLTRQFAGKQSA